MQWRSFPFGWLFLPVSLIGQPFSQKTRDHFLPLLTSTDWWSDTQLELRRVFEQDSDFTERMFARQIAVMKGQAWNVVETLKTPDHGPLELTRRTRVCVWDELVDVPVAIPLRSPSAEMRFQSEGDLHQTEDQEEMDISTANGSSRPPDLIKLSSDSSDLPNRNRFDLSRNPSNGESTTLHATSPVINGNAYGPPTRPLHPPPGASTLHPNARISFEHHRRTASGSRRSYQKSTRRGSSAFLYEGDEDEDGDLGFAAAEDNVGNKRKVIVERLETVKSKNPVFTWC